MVSPSEMKYEEDMKGREMKELDKERELAMKRESAEEKDELIKGKIN